MANPTDPLDLSDFLATIGIDYDNLPLLVRSDDEEKQGSYVKLKSMTSPMMQWNDMLIITLKGISPIKIDWHVLTPSIDSIKGTMMIFKKPNGSFKFVCNPDEIRVAYDFVHDTTDHVGKHCDVCPKCEWVNNTITKEALTRLLKNEDKLFKIEL
jgi:hypothetical protein